MGRSKFPGKPSKLATKKRIRILPTAGQNGQSEHDLVVAAANTNSPTNSSSSTTSVNQDAKGLNESNGGDSSPSSGVDAGDEPAAADIKPAKKSVRIAAAAVDDDAPSAGGKKKSVSFKATLETSDDRTMIKKVYNPDNNAPLVPIIKRKCLNGLGGKSTCIVRPSRLTDVLKNSNGSENAPATVSTPTIIKASSLFSSLPSSSINDLSAPRLHGESPRKSLYSCRIIKANKRLVGYSRDYLKKLRKSIDGKASLKHAQLFNDAAAVEDVQGATTMMDNNDAGDDRCSQRPFVLRQPRLKISTSTLAEMRNDLIPSRPFSFATSPPSNKVNFEGPSLFSSAVTFGGAAGLASVTCNVCKVQNLPASQISKKFGAYNCEPCRKFISKMSKKSTSSPVTAVTCARGDGSCVISSDKGKDRCSACLLKSCLKTYNLPLKFRLKLHQLLPHAMKIADKAQLDGFHKKISSKSIQQQAAASGTQHQQQPAPVVESSNLFTTAAHSTSKILVDTKIEVTTSLATSTTVAATITTTPSSSSATTTTSEPFKGISTKSISLPNPLAENNLKFGSQPAIKPNIIDKPIIMSPKVLKEAIENEQVVIKKEDIKQEKSSPPPPAPVPAKREKERAVKDEPKVDTSPSSRSDKTPQTSDAKRQKIMLKGPRVKHVCRSASIALGQPLATFGDDEKIVEEAEFFAAEGKDTSESENQSGKENKTPEHEMEVDRNNATPASELSLELNIQLDTSDTASERQRPSDVVETRNTFTRKYQVRPAVGNISSGIQKNLNVFMKRQVPLVPRAPQLISIDFWENYDPAEVSRNGFGIIATESFTLHPLCFLCGSAGKDEMLFCTCCCEPYHTYCLDDVYNNKSFVGSNESSSRAIANRLNWLCPRCTCCYTCNMTAGPKVRCQKCEKYFHSTCLGISKRLHRTDRPSICSNCLKCKSCSSTNVSKFVGNLPHCINCFKLRQKGNFCPVCQKCYENDNLELKMMECGACKRWIHARCENLTDEQYNMLSILPEHIEFICRKCAKTEPTVWRDAVSKEFNGCLLSVIKQLSKSREACALLKLSPRKKNFIPCAACQPMLQSTRAIEFESDPLEDPLSLDTPTKKSNVPETKCTCEHEIDTGAMSLIDVKQKIAKQQYHSVQEFHYDMNLILQSVDSTELSIIYKEIISEIFPWFQNETKACTDALEESMFDSSSFDLNASDEESLQQVPVFDVRNDIQMDDFWTEVDTRCCVLCRGKSEDDNSRFLYCGQNSWIHANCALYSAEVFEEIDGSLQNIHSAISRGKLLKCSTCGNKGATVGCNVKNCGEHYHFPCARKVDCLFLNNQTTLCPLHKGEATAAELLDPEYINPNRPVYVELDRKKKKMVEPSKVRFFLGSLSIEKLGRIVPSLSDSTDAIVPSDFQCCRMYWSTQEPWKIVKYSIRTSIQSGSSYSSDSGRNFTVNHAQDLSQVQANLQEISKWHLSLNQDEDVEETEEEPQNNADLLPPEIKDAIFEDLPHDMLNSISMLDIFSPKLMTEDYPLSVADVEQLKDSIYNDSNDSFRFEEFSNTSSADFLEDALAARNQLKRTKKTCNINWNITSKKRKMNHKLQEIILPMKRKENESLFSQLKISQLDGISEQRPQFRISQLDGVCDLIPKKKRKKIGRRKPFKISQLDGIEDQVLTQLMPTENPVACERCRCTYRTKESYERHLANCDVVSTSDSEPDSPVQEQQSDIQTFSLNINTSASNAFSTFPTVLQTSQGGMTLDQQNAINIANAYITSSRPGNLVQTTNTLPTMSIPSHHHHQGFGQNMANVILTAAPNQQTVQQNGAQLFTTAPMGYQQQAILPFSLNQLTGNVITTPLGTAIATQPTQQQYEASKTQQIVQQAIMQNNLATQGNKLLLPANNNRKQVLPRLTSQSSVKGKALKAAALKKEQQQHQQQQQQQQGAIQVINSFQHPQAATQNVLFAQQAATGQPLMLQAANNGLSNNLVQYAIADNQNLMQYVTLPQTTDRQATPQYLTAAPNTAFLQGAFQMQPAPESNILVANGNGGFSMIPISSMQPAQPQVIGTLVQPQAAAFQMGVMSSEHMMMGSTPTLEMVTDPTSGLMYLASQPVYYGLETIVQNTVMSSQQFVSTAVQNVCQNATFSATTTQVFQTSKIEPIVEVPPGYVVLNNDNTPAAIMPAPQTPQLQQATYLQQLTPQQQSIQSVQEVQMETKDAEVVQMIKPHQIQLPEVKVHKPKPVQIQKAKPVINKAANIVKPKIIAKPVMTKLHEEKPEITEVYICEAPPKEHILNNYSEQTVLRSSETYLPSQPQQQPQIQQIQKSHQQQQPPQQQPQYIPHSYASAVPVSTSSTIASSTIILPPSNNPCSIPTNIVNPIQQSCLTNRPTNRVLPMQTFVDKHSSPDHVKMQHDEICDINIDLVKKPIDTFDQLESEFNSTKMMENVDKSMNETITKLVSAIDEDIFMDMQASENKKQQMVEEVCNTIQKEILEKSPKPVYEPYKLQETIESVVSPMNSPPHMQIQQQMEQQQQQQYEVQMEELQQQVEMQQVELQQSELQQQSDLQLQSEMQQQVEMQQQAEMQQQVDQQHQQQQQQIEQERLEQQELVQQLEEEQMECLVEEEPAPPRPIQQIVEEFRRKEVQLYQKENIEPSTSQVNNVEKKILATRPLKPSNTLRSTTPKILFEIQSQDGFTYKSTSVTELWEKVFENYQVARKVHNLKAVPDGPMSEIGGLNMLGLRTNATRYLVEQLPGAEKCTKYNFKYHKNRTVDFDAHSTTVSEFEEFKENKHEVARCIPYSSRSEYDMFSWLASRHRKQPTPVVIQNNDELTIPRRGSGSNLPIAMRYRNLQKSPKDYVGVYRSSIHGRGLFCTRDIEAGEMVIEYAGELIRSTLTDKRERYYDGKGIGCYMFKIDENFVVDATMRGNSARFINHSCDPNCYSKVVDILGHKHIIIFALRRIVQGEELTYDYKFPLEDVKIPCSCGAKKCKRYLN